MARLPGLLPKSLTWVSDPLAEAGPAATAAASAPTRPNPVVRPIVRDSARRWWRIRERSIIASLLGSRDLRHLTLGRRARCGYVARRGNRTSGDGGNHHIGGRPTG